MADFDWDHFEEVKRRLRMILGDGSSEEALVALEEITVCMISDFIAYDAQEECLKQGCIYMESLLRELREEPIEYHDIYDDIAPSLRGCLEFSGFAARNFMDERMSDAEDAALDYLAQTILDNDIDCLSQALPLAYILIHDYDWEPPEPEPDEPVR